MSIARRTFIVAATMAVVVAAASAASAQTTLDEVRKKGVIVAGSSAEYPPFEFVADGKLVGYDVEMADEIARRSEFLTPVWGTPSSDLGRNQAWFEFASQLG